MNESVCGELFATGVSFYMHLLGAVSGRESAVGVHLEGVEGVKFGTVPLLCATRVPGPGTDGETQLGSD